MSDEAIDDQADGLTELAGLLGIPADALAAAVGDDWAPGQPGSGWGHRVTIFTGVPNPRTPGRPRIGNTSEDRDPMAPARPGLTRRPVIADGGGQGIRWDSEQAGEFGQAVGLVVDCLVAHGGHFAIKSVLGPGIRLPKPSHIAPYLWRCSRAETPTRPCDGLDALRHVDEAGVVTLEGDGDLPSRAVAVLGDDEVGLTGA